MAEVCSYFPGWTLDYCLQMPAIQFFEMLKHGRRMYAIRRMDECRIAAIPSCKPEYLDYVYKSFQKVLQDEDAPKPKEIDVTNKAVDSGSPEARYLMDSIFSRGRRPVH